MIYDMKVILLSVLPLLLLLLLSCDEEIPSQDNAADYITTELGNVIVIPDPVIPDSIPSQANTPHIAYPEDSTADSYVFPEIVPHDKFSHSEYLLFISTNAQMCGWSYYPYAFLGDGIVDIEEGIAHYEKLDAIYRKTIKSDINWILSHLLNVVHSGDGGLPSEFELAHYSTCHVNFISIDGGRVLCISLDRAYPGVWMLGEVYEGSELLGDGHITFESSQFHFGMPQNNVFPSLSGYLDDDKAYPFGESTWSPIRVEYTKGYLFNHQANMYIEYLESTSEEIVIRSFPENEVVFIHSLPPSFSKSSFRFIGFTSEDRIVFYYDESVYTIRVDGTDLERLTDITIPNKFEVSLSPDGKHLAFKTPPSFTYQYYDGSRGVFIQNLETKDIVFYEVFPAESRDEGFSIVGWAKKSGVDSLIACKTG